MQVENILAMHIHDHRNDRYNTDMFSNEFSLENKLKLKAEQESTIFRCEKS